MILLFSPKIWGPIVLFCFLVLCFEIMYHKKKSERKDAAAKENFWAREAEANSVRKKDITFLDYITIPLSTLPITDTEDDELLECQSTIQKLSTRKILNLTGQTNTDLKLEYGPANLPLLSEYENNYIALVNTLTAWGSRLVELEQHASAITVLEYAISIGSDVGRCFYLLANEYRKNNEIDKFDALIEKAESLSSLTSVSIVKKLKEIRDFKN